MARKVYLASTLAALVVLCGGVQGQSHFMRGDVNQDRSLSIADPIFALGYLFARGTPPACLDAADVNDDGKLDIGDPVTLLSYLFARGPSPKAPFSYWDADPTPDNLTCKGTIVELTGDITSDLTLDASKTYKLVSGVFVQPGVTLTIPAGTTILGDTTSEGFLAIMAAPQPYDGSAAPGRLVCNGTAEAPVVFTSDKPVGQRNRGDWGGVIMMGNAELNEAGGVLEAEGLTNITFGGGANPRSDQDSGRLSYVRIEFGGTEIAPNNEINGLSLFACGSATQIDHLLVKMNVDDGVEWFGGMASLKYALMLWGGDDQFDYSFGWRGYGQYWVCQQRGDNTDKGFEVDNNESVFDAVPLTNPIIANFTLLGDPNDTAGEASQSSEGLYFRRGTGSRVYNGIVGGFNKAGFDIDDAQTTTHSPTNGEFVVDHCVFFQNSEMAETGETGAAAETVENGFQFTSVSFLTTLNTHNVDKGTTSVVVAPFDQAAPDFRGIAAELPAPFDVSSLGSWFDKPTFVGGVPPAGMGEDWTKKPWISYLQN